MTGRLPIGRCATVSQIPQPMKNHTPHRAGRMYSAFAATLALGSTTLLAAPTAADSFLTGGSNYTALTNLIGQGPVATGFTGTWLEAYGGAQSPTVVSSGLSYTDAATHALATAGGAASYTTGGFGRAGRLLSAPYGDATAGDVYFSFLIQLDAVELGKYRGVEFHSGGFDDNSNRKIQVVTGEPNANPFDNSRFTIRLFNNNADGFAGDLGEGNTNVNLVVGKITFSTTGGADEISVWLNPSDITSEVASGAAVFTKAGFDIQIDRASIARFNDTNGVTADEIRFGATWADVLPILGTGDTDGDGLDDSVETDTGIYVGATNTGTDPLDPDTDGDFLTDGAEVNTHFTNPNLDDTDGGGVNDATELSLGTNPVTGNAGDDLATNGNTALLGFDFFDYANGGIDGNAGFEGQVFDFDNRTDNDAFLGHTKAVAPWSTTFGSFVDCTRLITQNSSATRNLNGNATGGTALSRIANEAGSNAKVLYIKTKMTRSSGSTFSGMAFLNGSTEAAFAGVPGTLDFGGDRNFGVVASGNSSFLGGTVPDAGTTYTLVAKLDTVAATVQLWVNPNLAGAETVADVEDTFATPNNAIVTSIRLSSGGTGRVYWDDLAVATTWAGLSQAVPADVDTDTLRDSWENVYGDLTAGITSDTDTLTNFQEQTRGTNPLLGDSDGDILKDDVETDTGIFVSASNTGTDPCDNDSDDDGLADNVETGSTLYVSPTNTGSNPNNPDSDGDTENDGQEVDQGSNPNDANSNSVTLGIVVINGIKDAIYGPALAVQTVQTQFGDANPGGGSELNAAYARIKDGKLYLMLTGNLQDNFNKLEVFIDSASGGQNVISNSVTEGGDNPDIDGNAFTRLAGLTFDAGFTADYQLIIRRGGDKFDLDIVKLGPGGNATSYQSIFGSLGEGSGTTGTGVNATPIKVAFNNSNTAGVTGGDQAADPVAAAAVTTGVELCIALADLGSPTGSLKIAAMINSDSHTYMSNQVLGGLTAPQGNLGGDGTGTFTGTVSGVNYANLAGDQFFTVTVPVASNLRITSVQIVSGGGNIEFVVEGLTSGAGYLVGESTTLLSFTNMPSEAFNATGPTQTVTIPITPGSQPKRFFRVSEAP